MKVGVIEKMWLYIVVVALQLSFVGLTQGEKSTCELKFLSSVCFLSVFNIIEFCLANAGYFLFSLIHLYFYSLRAAVGYGRFR